MWTIAKPTAARMDDFRAAQRNMNFSYAAVGASNGAAPAGYDLDHNRIELGRGGRAFEAACEALRAWKMFPGPWTQIVPANAPIGKGTVVAMLARVYGVWWLNACRIVYLIDEQSPVRRFGFAYGTLPGHVETGEERFMVEWLPDDSVWYDIRAFSRPRFWLVRLAKPLARGLQRRFVRESKEAMRALHGTANALGFALCGAVAWNRRDRACAARKIPGGDQDAA